MTAIGTIKEQIKLEQMENLMDTQKNSSVEQMLADGKVKRTVQPDGEIYYMYYAIKPDVYPGMQGLGKGIPATLRDVFLIDDKFNVKYIDKSGNEFGDKIEEKILEDETEIRFASKAFSDYVSLISGVTETKTKFEWLKNQTSLRIIDRSIDSLEDLVFFPNLESIAMYDLVRLENLDGIENCTKLKSFECYTSSIKDYTQMSKLQNIKEIHIAGGNQKFEKIIEAIKNYSKLETLELRSIGIVDMGKIAELKGVTNLILSGNKIENIEGLEGMQELQSLNLTDNKITDITPLKYNTKLTNLNLKGNINIDGNKMNYTGERLEALNEIGKIFDRGGNIIVDIEQLKLFNGYKQLDLSRRNLDNLEVIEGITTLENLNLDVNNITLQDEKSKEIIKGMKNLKKLSIVDNQVSDISCLNTLENLTELSIRGEKNNINLAQIQDIISNVSLYVSEKQLATINNCTNIEQITKLTVRGINMVPDISKLTNLKEITLPEAVANDATGFENLLKLPSLEAITMYSSNLHGKLIDFSKLPNVKRLDLRYNYLNDEDIKILSNLNGYTNLIIDLSNNSIIDASALLVLDPSCQIYLRNNVNLSQKSKDSLKERFGRNVQF